MTLAEQVNVQVKDGLAAMGAGVDDQPIATFFDSFLLGQLAGNEKQLPHEGFVFWLKFVDGANVAVGDDQDVYRGFGVNVAKGSDALILIDDLSGEMTGNDLTEDARGHG